MELDGYIRVSRVAGREGDSFISPRLQREQIAAYATARGFTIAKWHEDFDVSGVENIKASVRENNLLPRGLQRADSHCEILKGPNHN